MNRKKRLIIFFSLSLWLLALITADFSLAAKARPSRGTKTTATTTTNYSRSRGVKSSVKLRPDRLGVLINFGDFGDAVSVTYTLTYTSNGISQGAMGTATQETAGQQRELLFGTCSGSYCRWHGNIQNARLTIDSKLKSGIVIRKPYRIKI
ncbi:MAG TPA: hypothetical protein VMW41_03025 [Candidatus Bathyarchaeia archaeon]|nr:hypothetical protein [Candidatus Bathyarchaeia archaeon]